MWRRSNVTRVKTHNLLLTGMNNIVLHSVNNVVDKLFSHDNNIVTALFKKFNHQYCYNLLTRLSNNDSNNEQACSFNIAFPCSNNRGQPLSLHQC